MTDEQTQSVEVMLNILFASLAISSLVISFFSIWLAWQFFKQSRLESQNVSDTVGRIEGMVFEVRGYIEQVVQQTLNKLLEGADMAPNESVSEIMHSLQELREITTRLEQDGAATDSHSRADEFLISSLESQIEELLRQTQESRIRSILPTSVQPKAVTSRADVLELRPNYEEGIITLSVDRSVRVATGTEKINASFVGQPIVSLELLSEPIAGAVSHKNAGIGTGIQSNRYNVHLYPANGETLPPGEYKLKYTIGPPQGED